MRLIKTLFKSLKRELKRNLMQLIAIVFIIGISVTLFTGLSSNSIEFSRRVDEVYSSENGNLADIWVTMNLELDTAANISTETTKINEMAGEGSVVEKRLLIPSNIGSISSYGLISYDRPTLNKEYDTEYKEDDTYINEDFFFVDRNTIESYTLKLYDQFELGTTLPVSFDSTAVKQVAKSLLKDYNSLVAYAQLYINYHYEELKLTREQADQILEFIKNNKDEFYKLIDKNIDDAFSNSNTTFNIAVNGIMRHPENIQNTTFNPPYYMMGTRTFINSVISLISSQITYEDVLNLANSLPDGTLKTTILAYITANKDSFDFIISAGSELIKKDILESKEENDLTTGVKNIFNQYIIKLANDNRTDSVISEIENYFAINNSDKLMACLSKKNYPSNAVIQNDIIQSEQLTYCFPLIFFAVAILVVLTTITQMMLKQRLQIGTMKALGISKTKILVYYVSFMTVIGIIGVILGAICGPLILPAVMNIKYNILYELPAMGYSFPWMASGAMLLGVVVLISLLTYSVIRRELSYVPAKSMRPAAPALKFKQVNNEVKHTSLMMALRNIKVHKAKSIMVILGVMGCTGLSICGFGINDTINKGKDNDLYGVYSADLVIAYSSNQEIGTVKDDLLKIDGMDRVDEFTISQTNVIYSGETGTKTSEMSIYYFDSDARNFRFDDPLEGGVWDKTGIGMSEAQANDLGLKEGDEVSFSVGGKSQKIKISKVFYAFACHGLFIYTETMPDLFTTRTNAWADIKEGYSPEELKEKVNALNGVNYSKTYADNQEMIESYMSNVRSMTNTILVFAIMLAVVVLINLAILNFEERRRDIATLRVLGFSRFEIAKSLVYEVMILTAVGAILGMFLGLPLEILVLGTNTTPLVSWTYFVGWPSYIYAFIISFFTAFSVNILISYRIDKIDMADSLKSIE